MSLSEKARRLYETIAKTGGGALDEYALRCRAGGFSHGSFCAARRELVDARLLQLAKDGRKTVYRVVPAETSEVQHLAGAGSVLQKAARDGGQKAVGDDVRKAGTGGNSLPLCRTGKLGAGGALATFHAGMPRVVGQFADLADWEIALSAELGDCVDIAEDAAGETYTVYSHRYEKESVYHVRETEDGLMVS